MNLTDHLNALHEAARHGVHRAIRGKSSLISDERLESCIHHWVISEQVATKVGDNELTRPWGQKFIDAICKHCGQRRSGRLPVGTGEIIEHLQDRRNRYGF